MTLLYDVGKGSAYPPYLVILKYNGNKSNPDKIAAIVGKGVAFDSGGYNLK